MIERGVMDLGSTIKNPQTKEILEKARKEADALLVSVTRLTEIHDRQYAASGSFDVSEYKAYLLDVSEFSSKLRSYAVDIAKIETDHLNRQAGIVAATKSVSFAQRGEGHLLLFLALGDEEDRAKFYQRMASLEQEIVILEERVVSPDGAQLISQLKSQARQLFAAGKSLIETYDSAMQTKDRFILSDYKELLQDLRNATRDVDATAMSLAQLQLELETRPKTIAMAYAANLQRNILLVALTAILLALGLGFWISRGISLPVAELTRAARELGKGELTAPLSVRASDEIAELVNTFNTMSEDLLCTTVRKDYVENIFTSMAEALIITSAEGLIRRVNKSAVDLLEYTEEELLEKPLALVIAADGIDVSHIVHGTVSYSRGETTLLSKSGQLIPAMSSISRFTDSSGIIQGMVVTAQDISGVKQAEEKLKQSDSQKQAILDGISTNLAFVNENLEILWVNKAAADSVGKLSSEIVGHTCYELWADPKGPCNGCPTARVFKTKKSEHATIITPDGRIWDEKGEPVLDADGNLTGVIEIATDITARKKAEIQLRESEERYRYLVENIEDLICTHDLQGNLLFVSSGQAHLLGAAPAEMVGTNVRSYLVPERQDNFDAYLATIQKNGRASGFVVVQERSGEERVWEYRNTLHQQGGKEPIVLGLARDVTERRRAEQVERRLIAAIEQTTEGILITDPEGKIDYINPGLAQMTGYSRDELIGQTPGILKSGEHEQLFYRRLWDTIKSGDIWSGRLTNRKKDGQLYYVDATITPVKDESGKIVNFVAVNRDITEHLQLSRQLMHAQKMEAIGVLAGGVAHDFNNILQVALGYSELILDDHEFPQSYRADLRRIHESARRGADLVQRLLTFSRKSEPRFRPLNLNHCVNEVRKMLERTIPKMIQIQVALAPDLARINADPIQIDQVLMNLAVNARDAMPDGGKLTIETENIFLDDEYVRIRPDARWGHHVLLKIEDSGFGIEKNTLEHIFEPFYTTKGMGEGTGLGLSMVHGIISQCGGHISCLSQPGKGTTFKLYFPALVSNEESE